MKKIIFVIAQIVLLSSCGNKKPNSSDKTIIPGKFLFNKSVRVDLPSEFRRSILKEFHPESGRGRCTGFWIKNTKNKLIVSTARHCTQKQSLQDYCNSKKKIFSDHNNLDYTCKRIILDDTQHDAFILELERISTNEKNGNENSHEDYSVPVPLTMTHLTSYPGIPLEMYGFPADPERNSKPTMTNNCFISGLKHAVENRDYKKAVPNNCSTWGGNSGGPIVIAGTTYVIGIPGVYDPHQNPKFLYDDFGIEQAFHEDVTDIIDRNLQLLKEEGIVVKFMQDQESSRYVTVINLAEAETYKTIKYYKENKSNAISDNFDFYRKALEETKLVNNTYLLAHAIYKNDSIMVKKLQSLSNYSTFLTYKIDEEYLPQSYIGSVEMLKNFDLTVEELSKLGKNNMSLLHTCLNRTGNAAELAKYLSKEYGTELISSDLAKSRLSLYDYLKSFDDKIRSDILQMYRAIYSNEVSKINDMEFFRKKLKCSGILTSSVSIQRLTTDGNRLIHDISFSCDGEKVYETALEISFSDFRRDLGKKEKRYLLDNEGKKLGTYNISKEGVFVFSKLNFFDF